MTLGDKIVIALTSTNKRMTQTALADTVGVTKAHISLIILDKRVPSMRVFCRIAYAIGLSPSQLLQGVEFK